MRSFDVILIGASVRAAAFSALRAGLRPWCADLFGDLDLRACCPVKVVPAEQYPHAFAGLLNDAPPAPWLYTGALENRPALVRKLASTRPLWGNNAPGLAVVRSPRRVHALLRAAGLPCPAVRRRDEECAGDRRWLLKPRSGAAGVGVRFWTGSRPSRCYLQEFIEGLPCSAIFLATRGSARLLGVSRQLIGEPWLNTAGFHYCGSVGPVRLPDTTRVTLLSIGETLARAGGLLGLFGIDFVLRDDVPWPVEVNPRYTASVEVHEYATGLPSLALHRAVFDERVGLTAPLPVFPSPHEAARHPEPIKVTTTSEQTTRHVAYFQSSHGRERVVLRATLPDGRGPERVERGPHSIIGKAILYAREAMTFPADGPWLATLHDPSAVEAVPDFADIPASGSVIEAGRPVLSFFARAAGEAECLSRLREIAGTLDALLSRG
jgi:predicted ATP-grasp superfamily ATP-dependent carboligase